MFIAIEGLDGSGKTSTMTALKRRHRDWFFTSEPCRNVPTGRLLCSMLAGKVTAVPMALPYLFQAARLEHQELLTQGLVRAGTTREAAVLVSDRWSFSTLVYQQDTWDQHRICLELIHALGIWIPDITIWIDVAPQVAHARLVARGGVDAALPLARLQTLRERYSAAFRRCGACAYSKYGELIHLVQPAENVTKCVEQIIADRLALEGKDV